MHWTWTRFDELGVRACTTSWRCAAAGSSWSSLDPDGLDAQSWHLQGCGDTGLLQAYLRAVDPGIKYAEPSIGRVLTAPEVRGSGLGRRPMREGLARCFAQWPGHAARIGAQARLLDCYAGLGFEPLSDEYIGDAIAHLEMLWRPS